MILNCKEVAEKILNNIEEDVRLLKANGKHPYLKIIRVDGDPASEKYVNNKVKKCAERNIKSDVELLPNDVSMNELLIAINKANEDKDITGILLQLPLPKHLNEKEALDAIAPHKDVDCLTTYNIGRLFESNHKLAPCTPKGIMEILDYHNIDLEGKDVLIINRSMLVGKPLLELMQKRNATVTLAHSKTLDLEDKINRAEIIVTAVGKKDFITKHMLERLNLIAKHTMDKVIIDVSINVNEEGKLCGDVYKDNDFINSLKHVSVTPVPGGVGLTTVASLLANNVSLIKEY